MDSSYESQPEDLTTRYPGYWLVVCSGLEAAHALLSLSSSDELWELLERFPVLALPEFTSAVEALVSNTRDALIEQKCSLRIELLTKACALFREDIPDFYASLLAKCGSALTEEHRGDPRINLRRAAELFGEARSLLPLEHLDIVTTLRNEGVARTRLAELGEDARANLEEALRLFRKAQTLASKGTSEYAHFLLDEGIALIEMADLGVDARPNCEEALRLHDEAHSILSPDDPEFVRLLMHTGVIHKRLADLGLDAEVHLKEAIQLYDESRISLPSDDNRFAQCLVNEGGAREGLAKLNIQAKENLQTAVRLFQQARFIFPSDSPSFARCLMNEGNIRYELAEKGIEPQQNLLEAVGLYEKARKACPSNSRPFAHCLLNEASPRWRLADLGIEKEENLRRVLALYEDAGRLLREFGSNVEALAAYQGLIEVAALQDDWEKVRLACREGVQALEDVRASTLLVRDRQAWMEQNIGFFRGTVEACLRLQRYEEAVEYVERGRSRALVDALYMEEMRPLNTSDQETENYRSLRKHAEELEMLLSRAEKESLEGKGKPQDHLTALMKARAETLRGLRYLEEELRHGDPDFFALARPLPLSEMSDLAKDLQRTLVLLWVGPLQAAAFFVTPSGEFDHLVVPGLTDKVLKEWVLGGADRQPGHEWIQTYLLYRNGDIGERVWMRQMDQTLAETYERLMGPIHLWLKSRGEKRVALVVAGYLGLLPLHAASWLENQQVRYLLEDLEVVYAPSAWVLKRCAERVRKQWMPVLGVANPEVKGLPPLPFSEWEVEQIKILVEKRRQPKKALNSLRGPEATLEKVLEALPRHPLVHLSCHGQWNFDDPLHSALQLSGGELTLAHLLCRTRLDAGRLVVLSACESGTGHRPESTGEEYLGLPAGFILAGAKTVVGSLWPVFDPPTALLMVKFYQNLFEGAGIAAALRQAQLWLKDLNRDEAAKQVELSVETLVPRLSQTIVESYRTQLLQLGERPFAHPHYWAAFEVFGSPEPIIQGNS